MLKAIGVEPHQYGQLALGTTQYLVGERRRALIDRRDRYRSTED